MLEISGDATGGPPTKRAKLEHDATTPMKFRMSEQRCKLLSYKIGHLRRARARYVEHLTELFFLQNGGNLMDYFMWKKRPTPQLVQFLKSGTTESDEDDDLSKPFRASDSPRVLPTSSSPVNVAMNSSISKLRPQTNTMSTAGNCKKDARQALSFSNNTQMSHTSVSSDIISQKSPRTAVSSSDSVMVTRSPLKTSTPTSCQKLHRGSAQIRVNKQALSDLYGGDLKTQEAIVERARQEAQVMQRIAALRKEGLWSARRLPKVQEPSRSKAHWDYLLEEMQWLAADFCQERKWKKAGSRKIARMVLKYHQDIKQKEAKAEKDELVRLKKIASNIAKQVRQFWANVEKVVEYKQQSRLDEKRKKALDLHLNFIVDQTEKYSCWLTEGLSGAGQGGSSQQSVCQSKTSDTDLAQEEDDEFVPHESDDGADDEETIEKEEQEVGLYDQDEVEQLQNDSQLPIEELIRSLPSEILNESKEDLNEDVEDKSSINVTDVLDESNIDETKSDSDFIGDEEIPDVEDTIDEQEMNENPIDTQNELQDLEEEGNIPIEELLKKYENLYDSDFDDEDDDNDDEVADAEDGSESISSVESLNEDDEEDEIIDVDSQDDVGLEFLTNLSGNQSENANDHSKPEEDRTTKEITDIAAEAMALQPKGYTLQTTEVKTDIPFLVRHTLREYQHVGLDWLATMYDRRLNGILADEMGLGKTIQTIALIAHLACYHEIWGPHLIIVPTSVMLNWELEFKKWCPAMKILTYYGTYKERKLKRTGWTKTNAFHVCITSYKLVIQDHQSFRRKKWKYLVLDEAQNIKNFKSQRWQTLLNFQSQRRLLLTGTPLQNSLMELWSLMHFLMPNVFQSHREFKEWFHNPFTSMVEGNQDYNENIVRRLHKVLRPFLLRRLKADVEKQMPKKYEHVVMCHLSKRQRYLYDDFMSQRKTKDTLASGHFMSVINILMQLRKVCNHPNMFDPRPIVSPFQMEGITYYAPSIAFRALEYDPFCDIDIHSLFPNLCQLEKDLPSFVAEHISNLKTPRKLITEIDSTDEPPSRPLPTSRPINPASLSQYVQNTTNKSLVSENLTLPRTSISSKDASSVSTQSVTSVTQSLPKALPSVPVSSASLNSSASQLSFAISGQSMSQPVTVQIQQTEQGTRLMIPSNQLSQLPASLLHIVQTSLGQQLIASASLSSAISSASSRSSPLLLNMTMDPVTSSSSAPSTSTQNSIATSERQPLFSTFSLSLPSSPLPLTNELTTSVPHLTGAASLPSGQSSSTTTVTSTIKSPDSSAVSLSTESSSTTVTSVYSHTTLPSGVTDTCSQSIGVPSGTSRPVMKVLPMSTVPESSSGATVVTATTDTITCTPSTSTVTTKSVFDHPKPSTCISHNYMENLNYKRKAARKDTLEKICTLNERRCHLKPTYGSDLRRIVDCSGSFTLDDWTWKGYSFCQLSSVCRDASSMHEYCTVAKALCDIIKCPKRRLDDMEQLLDRYVFVTPRVSAPCIGLHVPHPSPSQVISQERSEYLVHRYLSSQLSPLHKIMTNNSVQFPELRLIQYDCGKLQTLDILLRTLKCDDHRVLIFTQMTKMLDVLESFLNYHGHRYLRLDGTTRVEKRQALMDRFNADRRIFCFILSTRSGGLGVNLTGADTVIFYDSDWNPTMDAQAQDRCHRIGQTRDVHIYRLISEMTVEENILKKANQKRLLGDLAIEGGNFTMAHLRSQTIKDLFQEPVGLKNMNKEKGSRESSPTNEVDQTPEPEIDVQKNFEEALGKAEDETDVIAAKQVCAEQKAELAEFDESIPWDEREAERRREEEDTSKVEIELAQLEKELTPIERYAVTYIENEADPAELEEFLNAEEEIETAKKEWELSRLKSLKEEEERRAELEEDEMLFTYSRDSAYNQIYVSALTGEDMPLWAPPTPPHDDNDVYIDQSLLFLYEQTTMLESELPPVYVPREAKRRKVETVTTRKQKQRKEEQPRVPRSLFERPSAALLKIRKEAKLAKLKQGIKPFRPSPLLTKPVIDFPVDQPEWLIYEDWSLLQAVQNLQDLTVNLTIVSPAHIPNWDLVNDVVNGLSRIFRSPKQCKARYEQVIIPREEGRIMYDNDPKKQKKSKAITKGNRTMRTGQLYVQDGNKSTTMLYSLRFDAIKCIAAKRAPTLRPSLANTIQKNPKHTAVLQESGIKYETPLAPVEVAAIRAERIQRDKIKAEQLASHRSQQSTSASTVGVSGSTSTITVAGVIQAVSVPTRAPSTAATSITLTSGSIQKPILSQQGVAIAISRQMSGNNIVLNTSPVPGSQSTVTYGTVSKRITQPVTLAQPSIVNMTSNHTQAIRAQRVVTGIPATITVQELTGGQLARSTAQATTASVLTSAVFTTTQLTVAGKATAIITTAAAGMTAVQQAELGLAQVSSAKSPAPQLTRVVQQQTLLKQQQTLQQKQLLQAQKLGITPEQLRQQQLKRLQQNPNTPQVLAAAASQKAIISSQLVTAVGQAASSASQIKKGQLPRSHEADMQAYYKRQQLQQQQQKAAGSGVMSQTSATQVVGQGHLLSPSVSFTQTPVATLVKTLTTQGGNLPSVGIPVTVSISLSQPKGKATVSQLQQLQLKQIQRNAQLQAVGKVSGHAAGKTQLPLIIQQKPMGGTVTVQQIQQLVKQHQGSAAAAALQQILTSVNAPHSAQPTIIATVTQPQQSQIVSKVTYSITTISSPIQSLTHTTPTISLTQIPALNQQLVCSTLSGQVLPTNMQVQAITVTSHPNFATQSMSTSKLTAVPHSLHPQLVSCMTAVSTVGQTTVTFTTSRLASQQGIHITPVQVRASGAQVTPHMSRLKSIPITVTTPINSSSLDSTSIVLPSSLLTMAMPAKTHQSIISTNVISASTAAAPSMSLASVLVSPATPAGGPSSSETFQSVMIPDTITAMLSSGAEPSDDPSSGSPTQSASRTPYSMRLRNSQK